MKLKIKLQLFSKLLPNDKSLALMNDPNEWKTKQREAKDFNDQAKLHSAME